MAVTKETMRLEMTRMSKILVVAKDFVIDKDVVDVWSDAVEDWTDAQFSWTAKQVMRTERFFPDLATFLRIGRGYEELVTPIRGRDYGLVETPDRTAVMLVCLTTLEPWIWKGLTAYCERVGDDRALRAELSRQGMLLVDGKIVEAPVPVRRMA